MKRSEILVRDWMSAPVHAVTSTTLTADAYALMMQKGIRRVPVVADDQLVGIVTLGDLREARPSRASSLSIYELNYLLAKLTVSEVMTHNPFTVTPDAPLKDAARLMLDHKIGGLPVVEGRDRLVGIITESDVFRMLMAHWDDLSQQSSAVPAAINGLAAAG